MTVNLKNGILIILLNLLGITSVFPQVLVERSRDKVVISGISYYLHVVKKGETVYSVSKAYEITPDELLKENPSASAGLKEGQSIRIRVSMVGTAPAAPPVPVRTGFRDTTKYIYHSLQPGETIFHLSKTYNVEEEDIIKSNPGLDISKLPLGYEIAIPRKTISTVQQVPVTAQDDAYYHKVSRGETMYSISRQYGVSVRDLRKANRDIRFPQVGDYLKIPGMKAVVEKPVITEVVDTVPEIPSSEMVYVEKPTGHTPVTNLSGSFRVAVLLPFYLYENSMRSEIDSSKTVKGKRIYREINRADDWIYPRSLGFVEMYEGMLLAADTLRSLGLNIEMNVFDVPGDSLNMARLIGSGRLAGMDLIIGPVHSGILPMVASYAGNLNIPVISPVQLGNNSVLHNNPLLFMASSTVGVAQQALAYKMRDYANDNIVLLHSDQTIADEGVSGFYEMIRTELDSIMPDQEIKLKKMTFYSRSVLGKDSLDRLANVLSDKTENVIIIASEDPPVMSESITDVHALAKKYNISVFGLPGMRFLDNIDHKICFDLGLMIYSPFWVNYSAPNVIRFNSSFRKKFLTEPSELSYAWQGYDLIYYFLSGLAIHGRIFLDHPEIHNPYLLHTEYNFRRDNIYDGFENHNMYLIKYSNNYNLELIGKYDSSGLQ